MMMLAAGEYNITAVISRWHHEGLFYVHAARQDAGPACSAGHNCTRYVQVNAVNYCLFIVQKYR